MDPSPSWVGEFKVPLLLGSVSLVCIFIAAVFLVTSVQNHEPIEFVLGEATTSGNVAQYNITIDVAGGVVNPGVYTLPANARIEDAIHAAGGLSEKASRLLIEKAINRASLMKDGMKVYIPIEEETNSGNTSHNNVSSETGSGVLSINSASQDALETLSGVGPVTAAKIITNRPYTSLEELVSKKVIGQKLYDQLKSQVSL